ncbi:MAG: VanZ family [Gallionellaceae bacterium]|nr:MAG: VanZ family [Gallionellaceae bacterium]
MRHMPIYRSRALLRSYLTAGYALFIVYASLSPFSGWHEQGLEFAAVLVSPLGQTYSWFDAVTNFLAYLPFGLLFGLTLRARLSAAGSVLLAVVAGVALSALMEYLQMYLPNRISSNLDLLMNGVGALSGALLAVSIVPRAWFFYLMHWRFQLFQRGQGVDFGLALVLLWMFAQINPSLPMLGNVFITEMARQPFVPPPVAPFSWLKSAAVALNLLMLGTLMLTLLRSRRHAVAALLLVLFLIALMKFVAAAVLLKSWALLLWLNGEAMLGIFIGVLLMAVIGWLARTYLIRLAAGVAFCYLVLAQGVLDSGAPSAAMRLYHWHFGHLLNYNGLSQTVMLAFPLLLLGYLWRGAMRRE